MGSGSFVDSETQNLENLLDYLNAAGLRSSIVDAKKRYWFVRTESGKYYDEFVMDEFIAIGWNEIPCVSETFKEDDVILLVERYYPKVAQPTRVLNQVRRFCQEMKPGDIVIIPKKGNEVLAFGVIMSEVEERKLTEDDIMDDACPFTRKRSVRWIKGIEKYRIDPYLYQFLRNQHAISVADDYAPFIDRIMNSFYIKDGQAHFTLGITSEEDQFALDMPTFISGIIHRAQSLAEELNIPFHEEDIKLRINVQSPGLAEQYGKPVSIALVAVIVIGLFGGTVNFSMKSKKWDVDAQVEVGTKGLPNLIETVHKVNDKYDDKHPYSEKKLKQVAERSKIKDPRKELKQATPILDQQNEDDINEEDINEEDTNKD
jgi:restriction system protein